MSFHAFLNMYFLQFFFFRIVKCTDDVSSWYSIMAFVKPFSGLDCDYVFLTRPIFIRISGLRKIEIKKENHDTRKISIVVAFYLIHYTFFIIEFLTKILIKIIEWSIEKWKRLVNLK